MKTYFLTILTLVLFEANAQQLKIEIEGTLNFDQTTFRVEEAGEDFTSTLSENESTIYLAITDNDYLNKKTNPKNKWRVYVYSTGSFDSNLEIEIKRTGKGYKSKANGTPNIHDGENFTSVSNTSTYFFRGKGEIVYIPVQVRIKEPSVSLGSIDFASDIFFRIVDDW